MKDHNLLSSPVTTNGFSSVGCSPNAQIPTKNPIIKARVRIENGKLASKANASRLVVRGTKDISKTIHVRGFTFTPEYRELYVVMLEPSGYIWREVKHGCGINGHHRTLRELIKNTVRQGYEIEVLPEPIPLHVLNPLASGLSGARPASWHPAQKAVGA